MSRGPAELFGGSLRVTTLDNGLRVATDEMPDAETVSLGVWVDCGAREEPQRLNGVSHVLEHMAFKGTERRSARDIAEATENVGGHLNAYTGREQTAYYAKMLAEDAPLAVDIISDILLNSVFDPEELKREQSVILQEIGQSIDTPDDIVFDYFQEAAFPDQPLGRPVLGSAESVAAMTRDDVVGYMRAHYGADAMIAVAAGRIEHERFVDMIAEQFHALPRIGQEIGPAARYAGGRHSAEDRELEQAHVVIGFPGVAADSADYYAMQTYSTLAGGGMSSRLFQEIREKRGLAYSVYSFASSFRDCGLFGVYAGLGEEDVGELIDVLHDELAKIPEDLSEAEFERARAQLRAGARMSRESTMTRAETLAQHMLVFGRPMPVDEALAKLAAVTLDDVRAVARSVLRGAPTVATVGPLGGCDPYGALTARLAA